MLQDMLQVRDIILNIFGSNGINPTLISWYYHACIWNVTLSASSRAYRSYLATSPYPEGVHLPDPISMLMNWVSIYVAMSTTAYNLPSPNTMRSASVYVLTLALGPMLPYDYTHRDFLSLATASNTIKTIHISPKMTPNYPYNSPI